jgi:hypothetical protein
LLGKAEMKLVSYSLEYREPDGSILVVGGFNSRQAAENAKSVVVDGATFIGLERCEQQITSEDLLRRACVICGEPVGFYKTSWRQKDVALEKSRRACQTHPCPLGFYPYSDY